MICNLCNRQFKNKRGLSKHLHQTHKLTPQELRSYYLVNEFGKHNLVQCKVCKLYFKTLQYHIKNHNVSFEEYKKRYGNNTISTLYSDNRSSGLKKYYESVSNEELSLRGHKSATTRRINCSDAGGRPAGFTHSQEWIEGQRQRMLENNPFKGKKHTEETKLLMKENHADFTGKNNPFKKSIERSEEKRKDHKERCKKIWEERDKEYREVFGEKISKSLASSKQFEDVKFHKNHKSGFLNLEKSGKIFFRSSWEENVCLSLQKSNIVKKFKLEPFIIPYTDKDNRKRWTRIDFYIVLNNNRIILFEVKPKGLLTYDNNSQKINGYKNYCKDNHMQFKLITENELDTLDQILNNAMKGYYYVS